MTHRDYRIGLAASALALAGPALGAAAPPAMFKHDPAQTGVYAVAPPRAFGGIAFTVRTGGAIRGAPTVSGNTLYFGSADHRLYAVDARSGRERWQADIGAAIPSTPAIANGLVYVTARDRRLHALHAATGKPAWSVQFGPDRGDKFYWDFYMSSPVPVAGKIVVGGGDGRLYALDPLNGRILWRFDAGSRIRSTPAVSNGIAVFGAQDGKVRGVDIATGRLLWTYATEGASRTFAFKHNDTTSVYTSPSIADGVVVVGARDGYVYGLDLRTGRQVWKQTHDGSSWILSTAIADGRVYIGSGSALILQAADLRTGKEQWRYKINSAIFGSPSIAGNVILFDDMDGNLHALDRGDGHKLWDIPLGDRGYSTPVPGDGLVYIGTDDGTLYALATTSEARSGPPPRRLVYFEGTPEGAFSWYKPRIEQGMADYFVDAGYEKIDAAGLKKAMQEQIEKGGRSVVIFADDKVPVSVNETDDDHALIRRYLDAGGRAVFFGNNPLSFVRDKQTGEIVDIKPPVAAAILGLTLPEQGTGVGYHVAEVTPEGHRWGLRTVSAAASAMRPQDVTVTLALDEFGMAPAWAKDYAKGGMLIQLSPPRNRTVDMQPYQLVAEHGL